MPSKRRGEAEMEVHADTCSGAGMFTSYIFSHVGVTVVSGSRGQHRRAQLKCVNKYIKFNFPIVPKLAMHKYIILKFVGSIRSTSSSRKSWIKQLSQRYETWEDVQEDETAHQSKPNEQQGNPSTQNKLLVTPTKLRIKCLYC